jgi:tRNA(Arg) A34 adenosine deaminase TadA
MNEKQKIFMSEAIRLASQNIKMKNGGPFGAVVVKDGKIIATGFNEVLHSNDPTAHAEIVAIRRACEILGSFQLNGCEIYSSCEPCPMCLGAIYWARPDKLYYAASRHDAGRAGFDDDFIYKELAAETNDRKIPTEQIMQEEASSLFDKWIELDLGIKY